MVLCLQTANVVAPLIGLNCELGRGEEHAAPDVVVSGMISTTSSGTATNLTGYR